MENSAKCYNLGAFHRLAFGEMRLSFGEMIDVLAKMYLDGFVKIDFLDKNKDTEETNFFFNN
jgi:hypothetical protein